MSEIKDWMALAKPDPEWEKVGRYRSSSRSMLTAKETVQETFSGNAPDIGDFPDVESLRKWITESKMAMTEQMGAGIEGVKSHDQQVTMRDGEQIACRIYQPENPPAGGSPLAVIYHGGGYCIGGLENEELLCQRLTAKLGMTCVNVDYRLAPEYKFPTAVYDCHDATKWAAANASSLGADPSKGFIIGGTSAGGGLTAVIAHLWRDEKIKPEITGCLLIIPHYCDHRFVPEKYKSDFNSYEQNQHAPILSRRALDLFLDNYIPDHDNRQNPLFSPLLWETGHENLPPSCFQIAGQDPLRDEGLIFERIMREELGIKTKLFVYPGQPHGFSSVAPGMKASGKFTQDSVDGIEWLLKQS